MEKDSTLSYHLSPPTAGWPVGTYHIDARMYVEGGEQKSAKTAEEAEVILFEPAGVRNTGDVTDDALTAPGGARL